MYPWLRAWRLIEESYISRSGQALARRRKPDRLRLQTLRLPKGR
jgi:hypothetical protein